MEIIQRHNNVIYPVAGLDGNREERLLGLNKKRVEELNELGLAAKFGQLHSLVSPGLITATALFQGLQRRLMHRDNTEADTEKLVYVWKPSFDFEWRHSDRFDADKIKRLPVPNNGKAVFFVIATPNTVQKYRERYPEIFAWIERWGWIKEDASKPGMPENYDRRYKKMLWGA